jgi:hypothetical protein
MHNTRDPLQRLPFLAEDISNVLEMYFSVWPSHRYHKTVFILCDDYTEIMTKLFLLTCNPDWSEVRGSDNDGRPLFKGFHKVLEETKDAFAKSQPSNVQRLEALHSRVRGRREIRNQFFHSANLLEMTLAPRKCVDGLLDLLEYGRLLFGDKWEELVTERRVMEVYKTLLRIERWSFSEPKILDKLNSILSDWPGRKTYGPLAEKGVQYVQHGEDLYLRLCVDWGGADILDELMGLDAEFESEGLLP